MPLAETDKLLVTKTVPLHSHYVWYYLGGLLLVLLAGQLVTGALLVVHYEASVVPSGDVPGAYRSVQTIVNDLPHGWWIRSLHHWGAHLMIMAAFIHMFSVLLLKAYRRPRELLWWTGLVLLGLILTTGFTGYLLPWNSLSFAATRVGGGIAGATPLAGPLVKKILLAGDDVSAATLTRFFGLHVAVLPMLLVGMVAVHVGLMAYHGSSVPPSIERISKNAPRMSLRFWPEFALRDMRVWVLVLAGLLVVVTLFPPSLGEPADPMAPAPEGIRPEWYFLAMFKTLKILPTHVAGIKNLQFGVMAFAVVGLVLAAMPLLHVSTDPHAKQRRWHWLKRWCLSLAGSAVGWGATAMVLLPWVGKHATEWQGISPTMASILAPIALAVIWLIPALIVEMKANQYPHGAETFFSFILISVFLGYTLWEAMDALSAGIGLLILWLGMLIVVWTKRPPNKTSVSQPAVVVSGILLLGMLLVTVPLGRVQEHMSAEDETPVAAVDEAASDAAEEAEVSLMAIPEDRRWETGSRLIIILASSAFLLVVMQRRINHQRKLRDMGLLEQPES
jgi:cytochrome b6